jgi:hypothetical protein
VFLQHGFGGVPGLAVVNLDFGGIRPCVEFVCPEGVCCAWLCGFGCREDVGGYGEGEGNMRFRIFSVFFLVFEDFRNANIGLLRVCLRGFRL